MFKTQKHKLLNTKGKNKNVINELSIKKYCY